MTITNNSSFNRTLGIYIHIPFCVKKCAYCDFLSFENESEKIHRAYVKALIKEIEAYALIYGDKYTVDSVFIGGGTPSLLLPGMIYDVIRAVKSEFNVAVNAEITIEANPGTLTGAKPEYYHNAGINRLSLGAQSFNDRILEILERVHIAGDISKHYKTARESGFENINIDLIFGIPGQNLDIWKETLDRALGLDPEHISFYGLQIEQGTKLFNMIEAGEYREIPDESDREMYHYTIKELKSSGYSHYEISNAAKAGYECRHNLKYWSMDDYLGVGLGAHSYIGGMRFGNTKDLDEYVERNLKRSSDMLEHEKVWEFFHENSASDDISEYMFTGLRMMKGVSLKDFERRFGRRIKDAYSVEWPAIERYIADGLLILDYERLKLSEKGIDISNRIMSEFV